MEKIIKIDGRDYNFKATAGTPRRYLATFHKDLIKELAKLGEKAQGGEVDTETLDVFMNLAYIMAKQGGNEGIPNDIDEWLDGFSLTAFYEVIPQIMELWGIQTTTTVDEKKRAEERPGK